MKRFLLTSILVLSAFAGQAQAADKGFYDFNFSAPVADFVIQALIQTPLRYMDVSPVLQYMDTTMKQQDKERITKLSRELCEAEQLPIEEKCGE